MGEILTDLSGIPKHILQKAGHWGTAVHNTTEYYDKGTLDEDKLHPRLKLVLAQYKLFLKDMNVKILEIEKPIFCKQFWYAGTLDRKAMFGAEKTLFDIKSGKKYKVAELQTAAYKHADGEKDLTRYALYLDEKSYTLVPHKDEDDLKHFLSAVNCYNFIKKYGR